MEIRFNKTSKFVLLWLAGIFLSIQAFAQGITVKGVVKDNTGMGVIGANILVKGTTNGTITDFDGNFTLEAKGRCDCHFLYRLQNSGSSCDYLECDASGRRRSAGRCGGDWLRFGEEERATGSVTAIKPDELSKGITTNAQDMLTGKVAGVSVISNDGTPEAHRYVSVEARL